MTFAPTGSGIDLGGIGGGMFGNPTFLPAMALAFSSGLKAMGQIGQGNALVEGAKRRQQAAEFEAQQLTINAGQAKAASQREAYFKGLEGDQLISAIRARAGAGGTDPTVLNIIAQAMARRATNMRLSAYGGDEKARLMTMQAQSKRYDAAQMVVDAKAGRNAQRFAAFGSLAEGASLYQKYWPKDSDVSVGQTDELAYEDGASPVYRDRRQLAKGGTRGRPTGTTGVRGYSEDLEPYG